MVLTRLIAVAFWVTMVSAYLVTPPGSVFPGADSDCSGWVEATSGLTCAEVEAVEGITAAEFEAWNPLILEVYSTCELETGFYYCIQVDFDSTSASSSSTSTSTSTSSSSSTSISVTITGDGVTTPSPIQTGMISTCDDFYLVVSGDECGTIAADAGISLATFYAWNPAVGTSCAYLDVGDYVCIGVLGGTTASPTTGSVTSTTTGDGISTPSPIQTGMVSTCDEFHLVVSGDDCATIAADAGISLDTFYAWNPAVGTSCAYLDLGDYVCIDIIGYTPTTTPAITSAPSTTTTSSGDGISTPSPIQTGIVSTCNEFYLVVSGDNCATIAADAGISLATFYAWNPAVGTSCASLDVGDYVCIDIIGYTPTATTTLATTTTTSTSTGNGVTTPTPYEPDMVTDCDVFYLVSSGDTCASIAEAEGVTTAEIEDWNPTVGTDCTDLWLDYYICVGIL
ncbi:hypothetical protein ASPZODRAFT_141589 [Penicilliopsis zonata CBS 506.65]|uniref:LysM domain-containing protein n=1 Tax=Penicilliopsis zonata CBS 506.65 TaxID=1073090 RepID=A0A1L9SLR5_9EURO|nr:hypothetical protein ASPZODRAFT_141589 [Penicilliopsis zonata CBS 506.65]OJJ48046.1 hypothetical protein ASPZODRAFT_141589 [Penicilliopsis zonata CBS 506.65]